MEYSGANFINRLKLSQLSLCVRFKPPNRLEYFSEEYHSVAVASACYILPVEKYINSSVVTFKTALHTSVSDSMQMCICGHILMMKM